MKLEPRKYVVYHESATADEIVPVFEIGIVDAETGAPAAITAYGNTLT